MTATPWLDIVMPTYNRPAALVRALEAIAALNASAELRVIVVDDGSAGPSEDALPPALRERLSIRVIRQANGGPSCARNTGLRAAEAEYIAFVDDDVQVDPGWLAAYRDAIAAESGPAAFIGPLVLPANWRPSPWIRWEAETLALEYRRMVDGVYEPTWRQFFTGNALVRREYLLGAGGFDETFTRAEDIELAIRLEHVCGARFRFVPEAIGWHYAHRTLKGWLNIPKAYGEYDIRIDQMHPWAGHRQRLTDELNLRRNPLTRLVRAPARNDRLRSAGVFAATRGAIGVSKLGAHRLASQLLSIAYDAEHTNAFFRAAAAFDASRDSEPPINSPSTGEEYAHTP